MGLETCVCQIRDSQKIVRGTGFAISFNLVVTCAHVVKDCKAKVGDLLNLFFYSEKIEMNADVLLDGWNEDEDVAFLRLNSLFPNNSKHVGERLGSFGAETEIERNFRAFGFPKIRSDVKGHWALGLIVGQLQDNNGAFRFQLWSQNITFGMSGGPVKDIESGLIVGMVRKTQIPDYTGKFRDLAYAIPMEVICKFSPDKLTIKKISAKFYTKTNSPKLLQRIDYSLDIKRKIEDYTGREWLKQDLYNALYTTDRRVFFITGDPGTGKSAFLAHITDVNHAVVAHHFCMSDYKDRINPIKFVDSIADQLCSHIPDYLEYVSTMDLNDNNTDALTRFRWLIVDPLLKIEDPKEILLIVVDALDESQYYYRQTDIANNQYYYGQNSIADILSTEANNLPKWLKLIISTRKLPATLSMFKNPVEIKADSPENKEDIDKYIEKKLNRAEVVKKLEDYGTNVTFVSEELKKNSSGNFLYVKLVIDQILDDYNEFNPANSKEYPNGLNDFFKKSFQREFTSVEYERYHILLSVLLASREPISDRQLSEYLRTSDYLKNYESAKKHNFDVYDSHCVEKDMQRIAAYFPKINDCYRPYHKFIEDWLVGETAEGTADATYRVNLLLGHKIIAHHLLNSYTYRADDNYLLSHLPAHLHGAECWDELKAILTDLRFIEAKFKAGMEYSLIEDYRRIGLGNLSEHIMLTARHHEGEYGMLCPSCKSWKKIEKDSIGKEIKCPTCKLEVKLNLFIVDMDWQG